MALITNQWLKGEKNCYSYSPIKVSTEVEETSDKWSTENLVVARLYLSKENGNHQYIFLTQDDLANLLPSLVFLSDETTQIKTALNAIKKLSNIPLLEFMTEAFSTRAKSK